MVDILFARLRSDAVLPSKRDEDGAYDIYAAFDGDMIIRPLETVAVPTGIASVIPITHCMEIKERGSTGSRGIKKSAGFFDSGYRGEWIIFLTNCSNNTIVLTDRVKEIECHQGIIDYPKTKAIGQAFVERVEESRIIEITEEELHSDKYKSERGTGKLGSSGK